MKFIRPTHKGFTLLEMMVVLALISMLSLVSVPQFTRMMSRERSRTYAEHIANRLSYFHHQAKTMGQPIMLELVSLGPGQGFEFRPQRGRTYCVGDTGGYSSPDPATNKCDNGLPPQLPMTCAELHFFNMARRPTPYEPQVSEYGDPGQVSADEKIIGWSAGNEDTICFSADGRVLSSIGGVLQDTSGILCSGEYFALVIGKTSGAQAAAVADGSCDPTNSSLRENREQNDVYRVVMNYKGGVHVSQ